MTSRHAGSHRSAEKTFFLAMKLTAILLTALSLQLSATTWSQKITFAASNVHLKSVFREIERQTGFYVIYDSALVSKTKTVSVQAENMPLEDFLNSVFKNQPLSYILQENTIVITEVKSPAAILSPRLQLDPPAIKGFIRSTDGQPLSGVNIMVKGTKKGTTSAANGSFEIDANKGDKLVISSIGYASQEVVVSTIDNIIISLAVK